MFLSAFRHEPARGWRLEDVTAGALVAGHVEGALDSASRRRGLLGRDALHDTALVIAPCSAIHTFFMRFPIDVVFVDRHGVVVKVRPDLPAWRISGAWGAYAVCEVASGTVRRTGTRAGNRLVLRPIES
jgi:hypothetical protein